MSRTKCTTLEKLEIDKTYLALYFRGGTIVTLKEDKMIIEETTVKYKNWNNEEVEFILNYEWIEQWEAHPEAVI